MNFYRYEGDPTSSKQDIYVEIAEQGWILLNVRLNKCSLCDESFSKQLTRMKGWLNFVRAEPTREQLQTVERYQVQLVLGLMGLDDLDVIQRKPVNTRRRS